MPVQTTYPGVYIEELPSGVHTIVGVWTSVTAFVGAAGRGPIDEPTRIFSFADYQRTFGPQLDEARPMGHAVAHFFANGGSRGRRRARRERRRSRRPSRSRTALPATRWS